MPLRKFLQNLPQTQETVNELNREIERGEQIIRFNVKLLNEKILNSLERNKAEESIAYEEWYIKDIEIRQNQIKDILWNNKK